MWYERGLGVVTDREGLGKSLDFCYSTGKSSQTKPGQGCWVGQDSGECQGNSPV